MYHNTETPRDDQRDSSDFNSEENAAPKTKDKVFSKLFQDEQNQFCFDCGKYSKFSAKQAKLSNHIYFPEL